MNARAMLDFSRSTVNVTAEKVGLFFNTLSSLLGMAAIKILFTTAAVWTVFVLFPDLDLLVSGFFAADTGGFPLSQNQWLQSLRTFSAVLTICISVTVLGVIACSLRFGRASWLIMRPAQALFITVVYLTGPALIVNQILKQHYGRARPRDIVEFGGMADFTPVWQIADQCTRNCSFTSGEASSAIAMLSLVFVLPERWRPAALAMIWPLIVLFSFNRIVFGGHFLSDVLMSWLIVAFLMTLFARLMLTPARMEIIDKALTQHVKQPAARLSGSGSAGS